VSEPEQGIVITAADCGPGVLRLVFSRRERWFWRHRACIVQKFARHREHYTSWYCWTHGKTWTDYFPW
jgi:hypothetical protein